MERVLPDGRIESRGRFTGLQLDPGDRVRLVTGGGGGWGDPARRDPAAIQRDLRDGVLTAERAAREYPQAPTRDRP